MGIKIGVKVLPRDVILDTQGRAVEQTLRQNNMTVEHCRVGKYIELDLTDSNQTQALEKADEIAKKLLCNPLIEKYELVVVGK